MWHDHRKSDCALVLATVIVKEAQTSWHGTFSFSPFVTYLCYSIYASPSCVDVVNFLLLRSHEV